jgi:hypothetical protein
VLWQPLFQRRGSCRWRAATTVVNTETAWGRFAGELRSRGVSRQRAEFDSASELPLCFIRKRHARTSRSSGLECRVSASTGFNWTTGSATCVSGEE